MISLVADLGDAAGEVGDQRTVAADAGDVQSCFSC